MSDLQTNVPTTLVSTDPGTTIDRKAPALLHTCLVVSSSSQRAQQIAHAANREQWSTIICHSADDGLRQAVRNCVQLTLVDLQSAATTQQEPLRELVEHLAGQSRSLLVVCGTPDDTSDEIWSRQLGVWMYLPGMNGQSDLTEICSEARSIVEKVNGRSSPSRAK